MADTSGLFGLMGNDSGITAANIIRSRYRQPIAQAAMENAPTHEQFLSRPENSILPNWMSNSSNNSVMGKIDLNDPYGIEQARNANPTANDFAAPIAASFNCPGVLFACKNLPNAVLLFFIPPL
jgi:hypothetical protein